MNSLLSLQSLDDSTILEILDLAGEIKSNPQKYNDSLKDKKMYMLFQKTSTRTSLSFGLGMNELGGTYFMQTWQESNFGIGETEDEIRYVSRNVDIIMARLKDHDELKLMAKHATVPIINGCCNRYHPCQALADLLTIKELFGSYKVNLLYIGVMNNVFNSLAASLPRLGGTLTAVSPIVNESSIDEGILSSARETGKFEKIDTNQLDEDGLKELVNKADVVYTDTWIDMEFINDEKYAKEKKERIDTMMPFQINSKLLSASKALVMHDMPMHAGYEISRDVIEKHIDTILLQSENRRHAQKAILLNILGH